MNPRPRSKLTIALLGAFVACLLSLPYFFVSEPSGGLLDLYFSLTVPILFPPYVAWRHFMVVFEIESAVSILAFGLCLFAAWGAFVAVVGRFLLFDVLGLGFILKQRRLRKERRAG